MEEMDRLLQYKILCENEIDRALFKDFSRR